MKQFIQDYVRPILIVLTFLALLVSNNWPPAPSKKVAGPPAILQQDMLASQTASLKETVSPGSKPVMRLKIPKINVDAAVEHLGLTQAGDMDNPKDPGKAGWFQNGPRPGESGSAVIAGHRSWLINGQAAVFDNLDKLRAGDIIFVEMQDGSTYSYVVRHSNLYDPEVVAPEVFSSESGSHLNLIASAGTWNEKTKAATKRLVVFTDLTN